MSATPEPPPEDLEIVETIPAGAPPPLPGRPPVGVAGCAFSLLLAMVVDALEVAFPMVWLVTDLVMLVALLLIWGRRWELAVVILPEIVPGISMFPSWSLLVVYLMTRQAAGSGAAPGRR